MLDLTPSRVPLPAFLSNGPGCSPRPPSPGKTMPRTHKRSSTCSSSTQSTRSATKTTGVSPARGASAITWAACPTSTQGRTGRSTRQTRPQPALAQGRATRARRRQTAQTRPCPWAAQPRLAQPRPTWACSLRCRRKPPRPAAAASQCTRASRDRIRQTTLTRPDRRSAAARADLAHLRAVWRGRRSIRRTRRLASHPRDRHTRQHRHRRLFLDRARQTTRSSSHPCSRAAAAAEAASSHY